MAISDSNSEVSYLPSVAGAPGSGTSPAAALNAMRLPAIDLDQHGFVADVNATADAVFDHNIKIKDRRLFARDPDARTLPTGCGFFIRTDWKSRLSE